MCRLARTTLSTTYPKYRTVRIHPLQSPAQQTTSFVVFVLETIEPKKIDPENNRRNATELTNDLVSALEWDGMGHTASDC